MEIVWKVESEEVARVRSLVAAQRDNAFVRYRTDRNVEHRPRWVTIGEFWEVLVGALLTSQQRSGPDSYVARFMREDPFPLSYEFYEEQVDPESAGRDRLEAFGGIRFSNRIAGFLARNHAALTGGLWTEIKAVLDELIRDGTPRRERQAAAHLREHFVGLGPKQSRTLLQGLGLTRYEIPIDSRITRWLNDFGFPVHLSAAGLADPDYYNFVSDGVQAMCEACDVLPCVFDAAVFSSYDDGWTEENVVW
jgi:hypothetical protein